jgi:hypothetical protein
METIANEHKFEAQTFPENGIKGKINILEVLLQEEWSFTSSMSILPFIPFSGKVWSSDLCWLAIIHVFLL